ncbi:hypothetical protein [Rodentibacter caecimuris]|uniref:hypothetical protein n=1 Tax=Rodentibacter caecimuris TaxID=1796644 RepID=UPI002249106C|nr:hypothetical protein [Rodentibacter heylii]MCX2962426.1 hypothetical protein [Rodentibacter heylii]
MEVVNLVLNPVALSVCPCGQDIAPVIWVAVNISESAVGFFGRFAHYGFLAPDD